MSSPAGSAATGTSGSALEIRGVGYNIGGAQILKDVDLSVAPGEFVGVIGPNGAGKTTLFNVVSGLITPTTGQVLVDGHDLTRSPVTARSPHGVARTFQTSSVFAGLPAVENVRLAAQAATRRGNLLRGRGRAVNATLDRAHECLEQVRLSARADHAAGSLSHGDKRKLEIAIVLATSPQLLLLDEPMAGLGVEDVPELIGLVRRLHAENGLTVLMVEHHIEALFGLADRIAVLHHGSLLSFDTPDAVVADAAVQDAYLGGGL